MQQAPGGNDGAVPRGDSADIEKSSSSNPNLSKKLLARDLLGATKSL